MRKNKLLIIIRSLQSFYEKKYAIERKKNGSKICMSINFNDSINKNNIMKIKK